MSSDVEIAFEPKCINLAIDVLVPSKMVSETTKTNRKYQQILSSVTEAGLVEPIVVHRIKGGGGTYMILDGHMRIEALKDIGKDEALCIVAKDDEAFTYNKRVNRLSSVQEHFMILRAVDNGVSEDRIAKALGLNISSIRRKRNLLNGICPEAVGILKNATFAQETTTVLRRMKPVRQIEVAELMVAAANYSASYAKALLVATKSDQLNDPESKRRIRGISDDERDKMEREGETLLKDIKAVEEHYGTNMLRLVVANGYVGRLLENTTVSSYLVRHHQDILEQLISLQDSIDADLGVAAE